MRLVSPTDYEILESLSDRERNNGVNIANDIGKDRSYVNTRLPYLSDPGLVRRVGDGGLYEITSRGIAILEMRAMAKSGDLEEAIDAVTEHERIRPSSPR